VSEQDDAMTGDTLLTIYVNGRPYIGPWYSTTGPAPQTIYYEWYPMPMKVLSELLTILLPEPQP
jgi:hypothetical protein